MCGNRQMHGVIYFQEVIECNKFGLENLREELTQKDV